MKRLPIGIENFPDMIKKDYYYVDKTMFIEKIEMQPPIFSPDRGDLENRSI